MSPPQPTSLPPECVGKCSLLARERFGCLCAGLSTHLHGAPLSEPLASAPASVQLRWQRLPKIELHVHFDGAFDARCLLRVARERSCKGELTAAVARCASLAELLPLVSMAPTDEGGLPAMLAKFENLLQIVSGDLVALEELARLFVCAQAAQHVLYTEMRYSPQLLLPAGCGGGGGGDDGDGGGAASVVDAVTRGLRRGCLEHPTTEVSQILCLIDNRPEFIDEICEILSSRLDAWPCAVVGIDVAAGEGHFCCETPSAQGDAHRSALRRCAARGIPITVHAGESGPVENVLAAASWRYGGAKRIGHGYALADAMLSRMEPRAAAAARGVARGEASGEADGARDALALALDGAVEALRDLKCPPGLTLECCPTSSLATDGWKPPPPVECGDKTPPVECGKTLPVECGDKPPLADWAQHPLAIFHRLRSCALERGHTAAAAALPQVTISSDDPAVFNAPLVSELYLAAHGSGCGLREEGVRVCAFDAVEAAFLDPQRKDALRKRLAAAFEEWEAQY